MTDVAMTDLAIRIATQDDAGALAHLRRSWTEEDGPADAAGSDDDSDDGGFERRFEAWLEIEASHRLFWLAEVGGAAAGMLNMLAFTRMPRPGSEVTGWGYIANTYVVREHRDLGIGRRLLDAAIAHARAARF